VKRQGKSGCLAGRLLQKARKVKTDTERKVFGNSGWVYAKIVGKTLKNPVHLAGAFASIVKINGDRAWSLGLTKRKAMGEQTPLMLARMELETP